MTAKYRQWRGVRQGRDTTGKTVLDGPGGTVVDANLQSSRPILGEPESDGPVRVRSGDKHRGH